MGRQLLISREVGWQRLESRF